MRLVLISLSGLILAGCSEAIKLSGVPPSAIKLAASADNSCSNRFSI